MSTRRRRLLPAALVVLAPLAVATASCGGDDDRGASGDDGTVTVFAAASLTAAFTEIGDAFMASQAATGQATRVVFNFAGSSELVAQIAEGAPADVFASADLANMAELTEADAAAGQPSVFATNRAAVIVAAGNPLGITGLDDLADDAGNDLVVVLCAPEVPCGRYAETVLAQAGVVVTPESLEQNVKAVVSKVTLGEADAGIVYATDVAAAGEQAAVIDIPADINVIAEYPIAVTRDAPNGTGATAFVDFVLSEQGQSILASYGFGAPGRRP